MISLASSTKDPTIDAKTKGSTASFISSVEARMSRCKDDKIYKPLSFKGSSNGAYGYDKANRLKTLTAPDSTTTTYTYDGVGNLTSRTDANLHVTNYDYDAARHLIKVTSPLNQIWSLTYDPNGNVATKVMPSGTATPDTADGMIIYTYDALNRVTGLNYSDSTPD